MSLLYPVGDIYWPSDSGCGDADRSKFVHCVDECEPEVHKVWIWGDHGITTKVHTTSRVDIDPRINSDFATDYFTETGSSAV